MENNKNKSNSTKKVNKKVVFAFSVMFLLIVGLTVGLVVSTSQMRTYAISLENLYESAFYELSNNFNDIETNLSKSIVSSDAALQQKYLRLVSEKCKYSSSNLSILPITLNSIGDTTKFINQLDGYSTSLYTKTPLSKLSAEEKNKLKELNTIIKTLQTSFDAVIKDFINGYNILNNTNINSDGINNFSSDLSGIKTESIDYPTLIFDGPFSDRLYNKEIKGLDERIVTKEEAGIFLNTIFTDSKKTVTFLEKMEGKFTTFDFSVKSLGKNYLVQITERGGFLLTVSCYSNFTGSENLDEIACAEKAKSYLKNLGIPNMEVVWTENFKGICFLNFAPVVNGVTYYPDLIKVKVEMTSGVIIGYEAQDYAYNHINRSGESASVGATTARGIIDGELNVISSKLCVIPLEYGGEQLCYEFKCSYESGTYFIYVNANTGVEERVLKVIETEESNLLM